MTSQNMTKLPECSFLKKDLYPKYGQNDTYFLEIYKCNSLVNVLSNYD